LQILLTGKIIWSLMLYLKTSFDIFATE